MDLIMGDGGNLTTLHGVLTFGGAILTLLVMQFTSWAHLDEKDPYWLQWTNRLCLTAITISLMISFSQSTADGWYPFRPGIYVLSAIDVSMVFRIVTLYAAIRRKRDDAGTRLEREAFFADLRRPKPHPNPRHDWRHH